MKLGMSCYCLDPAMEAGRMNVDDVIDFAVAHGCEHIEFVPFHLEFVTPEKKLNTELIDHVREKCASAGIEISTYSVNGDLLKTMRLNRRPKLNGSNAILTPPKDSASNGCALMLRLSAVLFRPTPSIISTPSSLRWSEMAHCCATMLLKRASTLSWKTMVSLSMVPTVCSA